MKMTQRHLVNDFLFMGCVGAVGLLFVLTFELNYFFSIIFFMAIPALMLRYVLVKAGRTDGDLLYFSGISLLFALPYTYIAHLNNVWFETTMFPLRVTNFPIESFLFAFLYAYMVTAFYRHFLEEHRRNESYSWIKYFFKVSAVFFTAIVVLEFLGLTNVPMFYFWANMLVLSLIVLLASLVASWSIFCKACLVSLGGILPFIFFEYTALRFGNWFFPFGNHIGYLSFFGYTIPIEELMFALFTPVCLVLAYEYFRQKSI